MCQHFPRQHVTSGLINLAWHSEMKLCRACQCVFLTKADGNDKKQTISSHFTLRVSYNNEFSFKNFVGRNNKKKINRNEKQKSIYLPESRVFLRICLF